MFKTPIERIGAYKAPPQIHSNQKSLPFFGGRLGVVDGTRNKSFIPNEDIFVVLCRRDEGVTNPETPGRVSTELTTAPAKKPCRCGFYKSAGFRFGGRGS